MESKVRETKVLAAATDNVFHISVSNRGIIEIAFIGLQTEIAIQSALDALQPIMEDFQRRGQPINLLADNQRVTRTTTAANQRVLKAYKELPFHKAAGINANPILRFVLNAIVNTARLSSRVKLFHDREAAERWLLEP